jgi:hypothetical protein
MSPLALPREILDRKVDSLVNYLPDGALKDVLLQLKHRPTFQEQWPEQWEQGLIKGKKRIKTLESIRADTYTFNDIIQEDPEIYEWWQNIR